MISSRQDALTRFLTGLVAPWWRVKLLAVCAGAVALGCRDSQAPPVSGLPTVTTVPAATASADEKVRVALDHYEPMYKIDAKGRVTHLRLQGRHLPVAVLAEVGKLTEVQALDFWGTTLNDEGLAQLKDLQKLRSIGLGSTAVTD